MKKFLIAAAAAAMFVTTSVNAENVKNNQNNATVMDVVA